MRAFPFLTAAVVAAWSAGLAGCRNACQDLCKEMADFAEECGQTVSRDDLRACYEANSRKALAEGGSDTAGDAYDVATCRDVAGKLREEWTCDDIAPYFDKGGSKPADTGSDTGA